MYLKNKVTTRMIWNQELNKMIVMLVVKSIYLNMMMNPIMLSHLKKILNKHFIYTLL